MPEPIITKLEYSPRSARRTYETKGAASRLGRSIGSRAIDKPNLSKLGSGRRGRRGLGPNLSIPTGGIPGSRDATGSLDDIDRDGWAREGSKRPVWVGLSSGVKPSDRIRPIIQIDKDKAQQRENLRKKLKYGDKDASGRTITRANGPTWLKDLSNRQISEILVPDSIDAHLNMWLDSHAASLKSKETARNWFFDEFKERPWLQIDYSEKVLSENRKALQTALDESPAFEWAVRNYGAPIFSTFTKESVEMRKKAQINSKLYDDLKKRYPNAVSDPVFSASSLMGLELVAFNPNYLIDRISWTSNDKVPSGFIKNKIPSDADVTIERSIPATLVHEWAHWYHNALLMSESYSTEKRMRPPGAISNPEDSSFDDKNRIALEYGTNNGNMSLHTNKTPLEDSLEEPRTITSYGHVSRKEMFAEGMLAYMHPNEEMKNKAINKKLKNDIESILVDANNEKPWLNLKKSTVDNSLSSGRRNRRITPTGSRMAVKPNALSSGKKEKDMPAFPRKPTYGPLLGKANDKFGSIKTWQEFKDVYESTEITYLDYETTGLVMDEFNESSGNGFPTQIGAIKTKNGEITSRFNVYVNPGIPLDKWEQWSRDNLKDSNNKPYTDDFIQKQISITEAHKQLTEFIGPNALLGVQNAAFDKDVLEDSLTASGIDWRPDGWIDLKDVAEMSLPRWSEKNQDGPKKFDKEKNTFVPSNSLKNITEYLGVELGDKHHTADADAEATAQSMKIIIDKAIKNNWSTDLFSDSKRKEKLKREMDEYYSEIIKFRSDKNKYIQKLQNVNKENSSSLSSGVNNKDKITFKGKPWKNKKNTLGDEQILPFSSQVVQYPKEGPLGLSYFRGEDDYLRGLGWWVDCLLYRDKNGKILGILNHYPQNMPAEYPGGPSEKKGNINIFINPNNKKSGIGTALLEEAIKRYDVDLNKQRYSEEGANFINNYVRKLPENRDKSKLSSGSQPRMNLSDEEKREIIAIASQRTDDFSKSVVAQFRRNGKLSDKQWNALNRATLRRLGLSSGKKILPEERKEHRKLVNQSIKYLRNSDLQITEIDLQNKKTGKITKSPIFTVAGRPIILVDVNGVRVPFYQSTGRSGKQNVPIGEWYPIFGIGKITLKYDEYHQEVTHSGGWFNKGTEEEILDYYGVPELKQIAQFLNGIPDLTASKIPFNVIDEPWPENKILELYKKNGIQPKDFLETTLTQDANGRLSMGGRKRKYRNYWRNVKYKIPEQFYEIINRDLTPVPTHRDAGGSNQRAAIARIQANRAKLGIDLVSTRTVKDELKESGRKRAREVKLAVQDKNGDVVRVSIDSVKERKYENIFYHDLTVRMKKNGVEVGVLHARIDDDGRLGNRGKLTISEILVPEDYRRRGHGQLMLELAERYNIDFEKVHHSSKRSELGDLFATRAPLSSGKTNRANRRANNSRLSSGKNTDIEPRYLPIENLTTARDSNTDTNLQTPANQEFQSKRRAARKFNRELVGREAKFPLEIQLAIVEDYKNSKLTINEIAKKFNTNKDYVMLLARQYNSPHRNKPLSPLTGVQKANVIDAIKNNMPNMEIQKKFNVSRQQIGRLKYISEQGLSRELRLNREKVRIEKQNEEIIELFNEGLRGPEITERINKPLSYVYRVLKDDEKIRPTLQRKRRGKFYIIESKLREFFINGGSIADAMEKFNMTEIQIRSWRRSQNKKNNQKLPNNSLAPAGRNAEIAEYFKQGASREELAQMFGMRRGNINKILQKQKTGVDSSLSSGKTNRANRRANNSRLSSGKSPVLNDEEKKQISNILKKEFPEGISSAVGKMADYSGSRLQNNRDGQVVLNPQEEKAIDAIETIGRTIDQRISRLVDEREAAGNPGESPEMQLLLKKEKAINATNIYLRKMYQSTEDALDKLKKFDKQVRKSIVSNIYKIPTKTSNIDKEYSERNNKISGSYLVQLLKDVRQNLTAGEYRAAENFTPPVSKRLDPYGREIRPRKIINFEAMTAWLIKDYPYNLHLTDSVSEIDMAFLELPENQPIIDDVTLTLNLADKISKDLIRETQKESRKISELSDAEILNFVEKEIYVDVEAFNPETGSTKYRRNILTGKAFNIRPEVVPKELPEFDSESSLHALNEKSAKDLLIKTLQEIFADNDVIQTSDKLYKARRNTTIELDEKLAKGIAPQYVAPSSLSVEEAIRFYGDKAGLILEETRELNKQRESYVEQGLVPKMRQGVENELERETAKLKRELFVQALGELGVVFTKPENVRKTVVRLYMQRLGEFYQWTKGLGLKEGGDGKNRPDETIDFSKNNPYEYAGGEKEGRHAATIPLMNKVLSLIPENLTNGSLVVELPAEEAERLTRLGASETFGYLGKHKIISKYFADAWVNPLERGGSKLSVIWRLVPGNRRAHAINVLNGKVLITQEPAPTDGPTDAWESVALHEIIHGVEYANPVVTALEWMYWASRRKADEALRTVRRKDGKEYRDKSEKGVVDEWGEPYAGKIYEGRPFDAFEILTTGMQSLFYENTSQNADPSHRAFTIGVLVAAGVGNRRDSND